MWIYNHNTPTFSDQELKHYGVLGMKWGRRKNRSLGIRNKNGTIRPKTFLNKEKAVEKRPRNTGKTKKQPRKTIDWHNKKAPRSLPFKGHSSDGKTDFRFRAK